VGVCGKDEASSYVNANCLLPLIERFANDFLAANPPKLSALYGKDVKPNLKPGKPELLKLPPFFGQLVKLHLAVKNDRKGVQHYGKVPQATQQRI
jgi:hypothetical protein